MSNSMLNIQSKDFVILANKLERIGRAELPVAVRSTLNSLAFDMKGTKGQRGEIDKSAEKEFEFRRNKSLFRAMTGVSKASGLTISSMQSESGIIKRSGKDKLAQGLADQTQGGKTKQKATPLISARTGSRSKFPNINRKKYGRKVRQKFLLEEINNAIPIKKQRGKRFVQLALRAERTGRPVLITGRKGDNLLAYVEDMGRNDDGSLDFELVWMYKINRDGSVNLKEKSPFIETAVSRVGRRMSKEFVKQANKRINKAFKK